MADIWYNLFPNKSHKSGDTKPCLIHFEELLKIEEAGEYKVCIWAPKEGKKAYSMKLTKVETENEQSETKPVQQQVNRPVENKPSNPKSLFKK